MDDVVDILIVIFSSEIRILIESRSIRSSMFKCLPCENKANDIETVTLDTGKMVIGFVKWEWCTNKADVVCVKEALADVGRQVGSTRVFGVASEVYPAERQDPATQSISVGKKAINRPCWSLKSLPSMTTFIASVCPRSWPAGEHGSIGDDQITH